MSHVEYDVEILGCECGETPAARLLRAIPEFNLSVEEALRVVRAPVPVALRAQVSSPRAERILERLAEGGIRARLI